MDDDVQRSRMLTRAKAAVLSGDFSIAENIYRTYLIENPQDAEVLKSLASLYVKTGNDKEALCVYDRILDFSPDDVESLNEEGAIYRRLKDYSKSVELLSKAIAIDETDIQSFYNLGFTYKNMGKYDSAIRALGKVIEVDPEDVLAFNHMGTIYSAEGNYEKALEFYHRGLLIDSNHPVIHYNMAKTYVVMGKKESADMEFLKALKIKPLWKDLCMDYADFLMDNDNLDNAERILDKYSDFNPLDEDLKSRQKRLQVLMAEREESRKNKESIIIKNIISEPKIESYESSGLAVQKDKNFETEKISDDITAHDKNEKDAVNGAVKNNETELKDIIDDTSSIVPPYEKSPDLDIEQLTLDSTDEREFFKAPLGDEISAGEDTDLDSLVVEEDYDIEEDSEIIVGDKDSRDSYSESAKDIYLEGEEEVIDHSDDKPLTVTSKPADKVEDTCSGPLLPMHKSEREQIFEENNPKETATVNDSINSLKDRETACKYRKEVMMFQELSALTQSLPKDERDFFNESEKNLQLEYIISRLSGKPGLLSASSEVRKRLNIEDDEEFLNRYENLDTLVYNVFAQIRPYIKNLPDKGLSIALDEMVKNILCRIF